MRGRSLTARLAINQCDPGWDALKGPILAWATQVWIGRVPKHTMQRAWMHAQARVSSSYRPQAAAGGAAGTYMAALRRVGWASPAYNVIRTLDGTLLSVDQEAPKTIIRYLQDDYQITSAAASSIFKDVCPQQSVGGHAAGSEASPQDRHVVHHGRLIPWFQPAASVINSKWAKERAPSAIASAASLPEGGWWTQSRLFAEGLATDPFCKLCHGAIGDLRHRMFLCPKRKERIEEQCPAWLLKAAEKESDNPLFTMGVPARPQCPAPPPASEHWVGTPPADGAIAVGLAYTDGALKGTVPRARRAGWAFIVVDGTSPAWGKYGVCSEAYPTVLRSELQALVEILRITSGPIVIHVDNLEVVDGISNGEGWCCRPNRDGADLWRQIWARMKDLDGLVSVRKVKAHLKYQHVLEGKISWHEWIGNGIADTWAKQGSKVASQLSPCHRLNSEWLKACAFYRWAVGLAAEWTIDTEANVPEPPPSTAPAAAPKAKPKDKPPPIQHELWRSRKHGWCRLCGINGPWPRDARPAIFARPCAGTLGMRSGIVGRERAISPGKAAYDDGVIAMTVLFASGAERAYYEPRTSLAASALPPASGGHAEADRAASFDQAPSTPSAEHSAEVNVTAQVSEIPPLFFDQDEEDPFGYNALGFDDPSAAAEPLARQGSSPTRVDNGHQLQGAHRSHSLRRTGNIVWCDVCGRHAAIRLGVGLLRVCRGEATGGYPTRIARLKAGLHPMTGERT